MKFHWGISAQVYRVMVFGAGANLTGSCSTLHDGVSKFVQRLKFHLSVNIFPSLHLSVNILLQLHANIRFVPHLCDIEFGNLAHTVF